MPINNTNSFLIKLKTSRHGKNYLCQRDNHNSKEPKLCPRCEKEDRLRKKTSSEKKGQMEKQFSVLDVKH